MEQTGNVKKLFGHQAVKVGDRRIMFYYLDTYGRIQSGPQELIAANGGTMITRVQAREIIKKQVGKRDADDSMRDIAQVAAAEAAVARATKGGAAPRPAG